MPSEYTPVALQRLVRARANYRCEYCCCPADHATETFCFEHIFPFSKGGPTSEENLAYSCSGCNMSKGIRTEGFDEVTQATALLFHPRTQVWADHFDWSEDLLTVVPLTPIGRVTVTTLKLNRLGVRNLRRVLARFDLHPPND